MTTSSGGELQPRTVRDVDQTSDVSFDVELDEEPAPGLPAPVDAPDLDRVRKLPIIPAHLRTLHGVVTSVKATGGRTGYRLGRHAWSTPRYVALAVFWAPVGVLKLLGRQMRWWWHPELSSLLQHAANINDTKEGRALHHDIAKARKARGLTLLGELAALAIGVFLLWTLAPRWLAVLVALLAVPLLAHVGRPVDKPIVSAALVIPRHRRINADIVLRAYYSASLGHPEKPDMQIGFASTMSRDRANTGSQVVVDLPYGRTFADAVKAKGQLASGLDVTEFQVFLTRDKTSVRRHMLFVADRDPLAIPAGPTPMLDLKPRDIWKPCWFGLDERGQRVMLDLLWNSVLVGAQPRKGKTFSARLLGLYGAADPYVKLFIADGKNSPDWRSFALVADRMVFGTAPTAADGDPIDRLIDMLKLIKKHIERVNAILSGLPPQQCPDGKLTRELARDLRFPELRVWMLIMEEFQVYYELDDQEANKEIAGLLSFIQAVGPSAGVIILSSSQKPSGVGAGDVQRLFNRFRDNHAVRFALKCGNRNVSEAVLGTEAYGEGYDASALPVGPEYRGVGYLYGASDQTPTVRCHLADKLAAERILVAARQHREALGTLTGEAGGDVVIEGTIVDPLTDALAVIAQTEANISWPRLAARLAEQLPERYAEIDAAALSARLRALGVKGKSVADAEFFRSGRGQGVARQQLEQLAAERTSGR